MSHTTALVAALACLAVMSAIYFILVRSRRESGLGNELVPMILVPALIGLFVTAAAEGISGVRALLAEGLSMSAVLAGGADLVVIAALLLTVILFRALVVALRRKSADPGNVTPLTPRPTAPGPTAGEMKKAA